MRQTFCLTFACKKSKQDKKGYSPVVLTIIINGERTCVSLPRKEKPADFEKDGKSIRQFKDAIITKVNNIVTDLERKGVEVTASNVKAAYVGVDRTYRLSDLKKDYMKVIEVREVKTKKKYEQGIDSLIETIGDKELSRVTNADVRYWIDVIRKRYEESTVYGYFTKTKSFFIHAVNDEKIDRNPFSGIRMGRGIKEIQVLSVSDYESIKSKEFGFERCERIRDLFIFACGCGLAWVDCYNLKPEDFVTVEGKTLICKSRQKTGTEFNAIVLDDALSVAKKYNFDFSALKVSNQKTNVTLKDIQTSCEVHSVDNLTFHNARHFYISRLMSMGLNGAIVAKCAGHKNLSMTAHYTHLTAQDVASSVIRLKDESSSVIRLEDEA